MKVRGRPAPPRSRPRAPRANGRRAPPAGSTRRSAAHRTGCGTPVDATRGWARSARPVPAYDPPPPRAGTPEPLRRSARPSERSRHHRRLPGSRAICVKEVVTRCAGRVRRKAWPVIRRGADRPRVLTRPRRCPTPTHLGCNRGSYVDSGAEEQQDDRRACQVPVHSPPCPSSPTALRRSVPCSLSPAQPLALPYPGQRSCPSPVYASAGSRICGAAQAVHYPDAADVAGTR